VRALNGLHPTPQFELWEKFDPGRRLGWVYNRYANIVFQPVPSRSFTVQNLGHRLLATFDPETRALRDLNVTHALLHGGNRHELSRYSSYQHLVSFGENHLYAFHWEDR
jgi:hypothetical protein